MKSTLLRPSGSCVEDLPARLAEIGSKDKEVIQIHGAIAVQIADQSFLRRIRDRANKNKKDTFRSLGAWLSSPAFTSGSGSGFSSHNSITPESQKRRRRISS